MAEGFGMDRRAFADALRQADSNARHPAAVRQRIEMVEAVLEKSIRLPARLPLVGDRIGLDAILGLVPVVGDIIGGLLGTYLIWEARNLGMSKLKIARMIGNTGFDTVVGFIPFIGDAADVAFKSNTRNLKIVRKHLDKHHPETGIIEAEPL